MVIKIKNKDKWIMKRLIMHKPTYHDETPRKQWSELSDIA